MSGAGLQFIEGTEALFAMINAPFVMERHGKYFAASARDNGFSVAVISKEKPHRAAIIGEDLLIRMANSARVDGDIFDRAPELERSKRQELHNAVNPSVRRHVDGGLVVAFELAPGRGTLYVMPEAEAVQLRDQLNVALSISAFSDSTPGDTEPTDPPSRL